MAYTNIDDPSVHFQTTTYTGGGANTEVTNGGNSDLKPDFLWIKNRTAGYGHFIVDSNRNISYAQNSSNAPYLEAEGTSAENNNQNWMQSVNTDGFTTGISEHINNNSGSAFVAWQWKANGGTTANNTDGTTTTTTQVNSDAGFSIVTWAGGGTGTLGHGLGETPDMWIIKNRDYAVSWAVGFSDSNILGGRSKYLSLNTTGTISTYNNFWGTSDGQISSTTIGAAGDRTINISGNDYVGYFFKAKQGYSKFGKYVGNGNASGAFVYTGFKPAWLMIKDLGAAGNWFITDHKRNPFNLTDDWLVANGSGAETNYVNASSVDYLSNGFKLRTTYSEANTSGRTYVYFAFAENPFTTSTGIPTTAR
tara:strand:+ start:36 stop:1127 length:1092 start_codon:yes stop_codon:yes gene_type:complete